MFSGGTLGVDIKLFKERNFLMTIKIVLFYDLGPRDRFSETILRQEGENIKFIYFGP